MAATEKMHRGQAKEYERVLKVGRGSLRPRSSRRGESIKLIRGGVFADARGAAERRTPFRSEFGRGGRLV